ncbi:pyrophosphate--fructose-6-phosphate 1-phosphotransferase [soil metagenome]
MPQMKIAMLTAGGLAPCLSSAVGGLIERYSAKLPGVEIIGYLHGYEGLLKGKSIAITPQARAEAHILHKHGGSPLGNSRVKLTNVKDCVKRGLVKEGEDPLKVAADQLTRDGITILHTIGGDDTNTTAADLAAYLKANKYDLTVVGLPKTVDNDVVPIRQTLGALTAAEQGAIFFENVVNEQSTSSRMLIIHEVMGRHSGWLTAATARAWRKRLAGLDFAQGLHFTRGLKDIDAIYIPEQPFDIAAEGKRLKAVMDTRDCVKIFVSEGAGADVIVRDMEERGQTVDRDAFGHVKLDKVNVGDWFGKQFAKLIGAEKTLVQKSGYFARSAAANDEDLKLIAGMADVAVESALAGHAGVVGHDDEKNGELRAIEFPRIKGGKTFDPKTAWFTEMQRVIGQASA